MLTANWDGGEVTGWTTWDLATGFRVHTQKGNGAFALSRDGGRVLGGGIEQGESVVTVWDAANGDEIGSLHLPNQLVWGLGFTADEHVLLWIANQRFELWDPTTGARRAITSAALESDHRLSPDGTRLLTRRPPALWDVEKGTRLCDLSSVVFSARPQGSSFSGDGRWLAVLTKDAEGNYGILMLDTEVGTQQWQVENVGTSCGGLFLSPDSQWLLVAQGNAVEVRAADSGCLIGQLNVRARGGVGSPVGFSAANQFWAHLSWPTDVVQFWDLKGFVGPRLLSELAGEVIQLRWDRGVLQWIPSLGSPWTDLPAASPMSLSPIGDKGFFRVKVEE